MANENSEGLDADDIFAKFFGDVGGYDVLSDPQKRQVPPPPSASHGGASGSHQRRPQRGDDDILAEFFRTSNGETGGGMRKAAPVENGLLCSLEDLFKGAKKKMKISRTITDSFGKVRTVEEILMIDIKPGWKKGTKITFPEKGNQEPGVIPSDLIFVIDEKPHAIFKRDGNDLLVDIEITLLESLTGKKIELTTLEGRNLIVHVSDIIKPGYEVIFPDQGMPISKEPHKKGNLRVKFDVKYPSRLTEEQKADLRRVLGGVS